MITSMLCLLFFPASFDDHVEGKLVNATTHKLTVRNNDETKTTEYQVADDAKITCDAEECKLSHLKKGCLLKLQTEVREGKVVIVSIKATTQL